MTELILVRHGETIWHKENQYAGTSDIDLNERGIEQAKFLAQWAQTAGLDAIYSSRLRRAKITANYACEITGLPLTVDARINEVNFGRGESLTIKEMEKTFPVELMAFLNKPAEQPLPEGEAGLEAITRAMPFIDELIKKHPSGKILIISHSTLLRLLFCTFMNIDPNEYRKRYPQLNNCALNIFHYVSNKFNLIELNKVPDPKKSIS